VNGRALGGAFLTTMGLIAGTVGEPRVVRPEGAHQGFEVLAADFHVHSFPGDGALTPSVIAREAPRHRIDIVGLTNHNTMLSWRLASRTRRGDALLIPGQEVTSPGFHIAAIGLEATVPWHQQAAGVAADVHRQGGVAIAAHPGRESWPRFDDRALDALDGVEVAHPMTYVWPETARDLAAFYARARARHPGIAAIGSTDFHFFWPVGLCRTYVIATARTPDAVLDAIRAGRTVACDGEGRAWGPSRLVPLASDLCLQDTMASRSFRTPVETIATLSTLLGLVLLALG
jgi:predicted metal-dependent phosphoesterase TrpH